MALTTNDSQIRVAQKQADQVVTSQTTVQADLALAISMAAFAKSLISAWIPFNLAGIISGYKFQLTVPGGAVSSPFEIVVRNGVLGLFTSSGVFTATGTLTGALATAGNHVCEIQGRIEMGATPGTLEFGFAQNVSDGGAITVLRGAYLSAINFGA